MITLFNLRDVKMKLFYYGVVFSLGFGFFVAGDFLAIATGTKTVYQPTKQASLVIRVQGGHEVNLAGLPVGMPILVVAAKEETQDILQEKLTTLGYDTYNLISNEKWKQLRERSFQSGRFKVLKLESLYENQRLKLSDSKIIVETDMPSVKPDKVQEAIALLLKNGYDLVYIDF